MKNRLAETELERGGVNRILQEGQRLQKSTICAIENGITEHPIDVAYKLCKTLRVDVGEIFYE